MGRSRSIAGARERSRDAARLLVRGAAFAVLLVAGCSSVMSNKGDRTPIPADAPSEPAPPAPIATTAPAPRSPAGSFGPDALGPNSLGPVAPGAPAQPVVNTPEEVSSGRFDGQFAGGAWARTYQHTIDPSGVFVYSGEAMFDGFTGGQVLKLGHDVFLGPEDNAGGVVERKDDAVPAEERRTSGGEAGSRGRSRSSPAAMPPPNVTRSRPEPSTVREQVADPHPVGADDAKVELLATKHAVDTELLKHPGPRFDEELVVISRPSRVEQRQGRELPGSGSLMLRSGAATLRDTAVRASVAGAISQVRVAQRFENSAKTASDAVYVLPLPRDASITDFVMTIGGRQIRGIIRERDDAEKIYLDAQRQGKLATLLHADRDSMFIQRVTNLAPGATVEVAITYFGMLDYTAAGFEFALPLTVSPRDHAVSAAGDLRDGNEVSVEVEIEAPCRLGAIASPTHPIEVVRRSPMGATVRLARQPLVPNKNLVLRYAIEPVTLGGGVHAGVVVQPDATGRYFSMLIVPPPGALAPRPVDVVLVPMIPPDATIEQRELVRRICAAILERLDPEDRAALLAKVDIPDLRPPTDSELTGAVGVLGVSPENALAARLQAAFTGVATGRDRVVCVIGPASAAVNHEELRAVRVSQGEARVFAFSIGGPPGLGLEDLARVGRGGVLTIDPERVDVAVDTFMRHECRPVMTEVVIDWNGAKVTDVYPRRLPPLCAGRPIHVIGRLESPGEPAFKVVGTVRGESGVRRESIEVACGGELQGPAAIASLWARAKILALAERLDGPDAEMARRDMLSTALGHSVVSRVSSFIAVDVLSNTPAEIVTKKREP